MRVTLRGRLAATLPLRRDRPLPNIGVTSRRLARSYLKKTGGGGSVSRYRWFANTPPPEGYFSYPYGQNTNPS
jgi:hypothetical protein